MAVKITEYLVQNPQSTYTSVGNHFGITRARISQLMTIHENRPDDFIEIMEQCYDQALIKRFSKKTLLKLASFQTLEHIKSAIEALMP